MDRLMGEAPSSINAKKLAGSTDAKKPPGANRAAFFILATRLRLEGESIKNAFAATVGKIRRITRKAPQSVGAALSPL
jgi:hypothetical protein